MTWVWQSMSPGMRTDDPGISFDAVGCGEVPADVGDDAVTQQHVLRVGHASPSKTQTSRISNASGSRRRRRRRRSAHGLNGGEE